MKNFNRAAALAVALFLPNMSSAETAVAAFRAALSQRAKPAAKRQGPGCCAQKCPRCDHVFTCDCGCCLARKAPAGCDCGCETGGDCTCRGCPAGCRSYADARAQALSRGLPFVVYIRQAERPIPGCVTCKVNSLQGDRGPAVLVGRYQDGELYVAGRLDGIPSQAALAALLAPPAPQPVYLPPPPPLMAPPMMRPMMGGGMSRGGRCGGGG